jgi:subtilisin family serine protease
LSGCAEKGSGETAETGASQQALSSARAAVTPVAVRPAAKSSAGNAGATAPSPKRDYVAGQLIVKFKSDERLGVNEDVSSCLAEGRSFATATADASASLDAAVKRHGIHRAASLVHRHHGQSTRASKAQLRAHASSVASAKGRSRTAPVDDLANVYRLDFSESADLHTVMQDLRSDPHVEYAHPNYLGHVVYTPNDPYFASSGSWGQPRADLWDLKLMHTDQAWNTTRGAGVVVAVVDTGVDITHPDLQGNVWTNVDEIPGNGIDDDGNGYIDDVHGWNVLNASPEISDSLGHGTHVAGTIAAQDNNSLGVVGVAPDAKIMSVGVFAFHVDTDVFALTQGILYATQNGADVINNSWEACGVSCPSIGVLEDAVRTAHAAGTVVVFAAGNATTDIRAHSPQNQAESIVVTATTPADERASFSNFGLVDVGAPGSGDPNDTMVEPTYGLLSLRAATCMEPWICNSDRNVGDGYVRLAGTSMAAPHVSGAAALILGQHPNYTPEQVRQVLRRSGVDANGNGYDPDLGYGRVDSGRSVSEPTPLEALIQLPLLVQTSSVPVPGSANGDQFQKYVLEYGKGNSPTTWTTIVSSTTSVRAGNLATWDASKLADGDYTFRLTAYKKDGTKYDDLHQLTLDRVAITAPQPTAIMRAGDITITGMANPGTFRSYRVRVVTLQSGAAVNADITLPNGGLKPVANGVLGVWHAQTVRADHYRIILEVTNADGSVTSENAAVIVDPLLHPSWPVDLTYENKYSNQPVEPIALVDLQGDGRAEILAGWGEKVTVFKGDGTVLAGWPQSVTTSDNTGASLRSMPLAGDIDGDGIKEVVAANSGGKIFAWGPNGVLKPGWPITITTESWSQPSLTLADVDRNGVLDVVVTDYTSSVNVFRGNGTSLSGWPVTLGGLIKGPATVADLNKDGKNEVIVGLDGSPAQLVVLNAQGSVLPGWPQTLMTSTGESMGSYPVVGDLDDDGDLEIAAVTSDGMDPTLSGVAIYHHDGRLLKSWGTNAVSMSPLVLADVDGDGSLEILSSLVRSDNTGAFYVWTPRGNVMPGWPRNNPSEPSLYNMAFNAPIVVDLDADGRNEIITSRQQEYWSDELQQRFGAPVQAFRYNGTPIADMARPAYGAWAYPDASPAVADIDGNGRLELVWTEVRDQGLSATMPWPRLFAWDLGAAASNAQPWPMYRGDAKHSGVAQPVVPFVRLTTRNTVRRVNGLSRFTLRSGASGIIQLKHAWQAPVKYAIGSDLLQPTTLGWGAQITVPPNQEVKLRIATTSAVDVTVDWW